MIKQTTIDDVFVADFTRYKASHPEEEIPNDGVLISNRENGIVPSLWIENPNHHPIDVVNIEHNPALFKRADGTLRTQCECICYAIRSESPAWMLFVELKYCLPKNRYENILTGMHQLKETCKYVLEEQGLFEDAKYRRVFVVSTPGIEPLDAFDGMYFDQEEMMVFRRECKAVLYFSNHLVVHTPVHIKNG